MGDQGGARRVRPDVGVDGQVNKDAAWFYPQTKDAAKHIEGYVAFWKGVAVA